MSSGQKLYGFSAGLRRMYRSVRHGLCGHGLRWDLEKAASLFADIGEFATSWTDSPVTQPKAAPVLLGRSLVTDERSSIVPPLCPLGWHI